MLRGSRTQSDPNRSHNKERTGSAHRAELEVNINRRRHVALIVISYLRGIVNLSNRVPTIAGFRAVLDSGYGVVRGQLRSTPDDPKLQSALVQYRSIYAMIEAITAREKKEPLATIDSAGIRRLGQAADTSDQEVIQCLFSYRDYCEQILRLNHE